MVSESLPEVVVGATISVLCVKKENCDWSGGMENVEVADVSESADSVERDVNVSVGDWKTELVVPVPVGNVIDRLQPNVSRQ